MRAVAWDLVFDDEAVRATAMRCRDTADGVRTAVGAADATGGGASGGLGILIGPLVGPLLAAGRFAARSCLEAAADKAAATSDHLEEAAALMQAVEDSIGDDLKRIGEGL
ncbi:hypothetical protein HMPREF1550_01611 [Actinomyces sp. oral taxon 877 str. F0543]|nr:hypothetical protein HMPREF1550_01611 [Actinomyces sp. oral taxon 877 str. F0543]